MLWKQQRDKYGDKATRTDPDPCPIKIGLIPAGQYFLLEPVRQHVLTIPFIHHYTISGSTNAVVYCTTGLSDPTTCAIQIAMGREVKIDLISCWYEGEIERFATNFAGYGFLGDVLAASEDYRWMGPSRYDFSGKW